MAHLKDFLEVVSVSLWFKAHLLGICSAWLGVCERQGCGEIGNHARFFSPARSLAIG